MKQKYIIEVAVVFIAVVCAGAIFCAWLVHTYAGYIGIPQSIKIAECTNSTTKVHFKFPKGHNYHLVLGTASVPSDSFSGRIDITSGTSSVVSFPIRPEPVYWLKNYGVPFGFSLTGDAINTNSPILSKFIYAQKDYDIRITFNQSPPLSTEIWLYWLQASKDKGR